MRSSITPPPGSSMQEYSALPGDFKRPTSLASRFRRNSRTRVALQVHHTHVRHVEHARIAAHRMVLFDLRSIVQRHFPAAEIDDFRTLQDVGVIERGLQAHRNLAAKERSDTSTRVPCPSVL